MVKVAEDMFPSEVMETLGGPVLGGLSGMTAKEVNDRVSSAGGTTTKGEESKFIQRVSDNVVLHMNSGRDKHGNIIVSADNIDELRSDYVSTKISLDKKLSQMAKSFGINVKNTASGIWKAIKKAWANTMKIEEGPLAWLDITKIGDTAKTTAKKKEFDALKDAFYSTGVLSEDGGASLTSGTWTTPTTLHKIEPFNINVSMSIVDFYLKNYVQFSDDAAATIWNTISTYLTNHPDEGIFSIVPSAGVYLGFNVVFVSKDKDYNIKITGKPESDSSFLFGTIQYGVQEQVTVISVDANMDGYAWEPPNADPNYIYGYKLKLDKIKETKYTPVSSNLFYQYQGGDQYVAPVFENGILTDKYIDVNGTEHTISNATSDEQSYNVLIGFDGTHISTVTREKMNDSLQSGYFSYSLAPITLETTIATLKNYIGKSITEIIKKRGESAFDPPIVSFSYGMQASAIVGLSDTVNFGKTDDKAELPKKNVDIMDQYSRTWAKEASAVGDVFLKDNALTVNRDVALPFPMSADATQSIAQAGTGVYDYAASQTLAGAETIAASVPATATGSISASITVPAIVPIIPIATVVPEVLTGGSGAGLWQMYNPSASNISSFGKWLWENPVEGLTAPGDTLKKLFQNPMDAIISLHRVYVKPSTGGSQTIKVGYLDSGVSAPIITNRYVQKNMGSVTIKPINGNFMDYEGVDMTIYLPFIGMRGLDTSVCMGATLTLTYNVDVLTGTCVAMLSVNKNNINGVIYQWVGSMFESVPVTSSNMNSAIQGTLGLVGSAVTTVAGAAAGGPAGIALGAVGMAQSATSIHTNIQSCGSIGGTAGALASRSAYITLTITQTYNPYNWKNVKGLPDNVTTSIGSQHGYIEGSNPTGYSGNMTQSEFNEFESLLEKGIYV